MTAPAILQRRNPAGPGSKVRELDLSDDNDFDPPVRAFWVGTSGTVCVTGADNDAGDKVHLLHVQAGVWHYGMLKKIYGASAGTTATDVVVMT